MTIRLLTSLCLSLLAVSTLCYGQAAAKPASTPTASGTSRLEVLRMLRARELDRLDRVITTLQEAVERDVHQERALSRAISAFSSPDPTITPLVDAWVKEKPNSYAALLARAEHYEALAWAARGSDWGDQTSTEQRDAMRHNLGRTVLDAEAALRLNPNLTLAVAQLISAAKGTTGPEECVLRFERFYKQIGPSLLVRLELATCLLPRWGGSYQALESLAEEASDLRIANPQLAVLGGVVAWDRGRLLADDEPNRAARLYTDASTHGDHAPFLLSRAHLLLGQRRYTDALADVERALRSSPEDTAALMLRAWIKDDMGRAAEAAADVRLVTELDSTDETLLEFREREVENAVETARARITEGNPEAAILRLNDAIALVGEDPEVLYWRGRAKAGFKDKAGALVDLQRAVQLDARHYNAILVLDFLLVERGQYLTAVQHWNAYLALEPTNGKALLARAKAHIGRGDVQPGLKDAKAACEAGVQEGCLLASEVR